MKYILPIIAFLLSAPAFAQNKNPEPKFATPGLALCAKQDTIDTLSRLIIQSLLGEKVLDETDQDKIVEMSQKNIQFDKDRLILVGHNTTLQKVTCTAPVWIEGRSLVGVIAGSGDMDRANRLSRALSKEGALQARAVYTVEPTASGNTLTTLTRDSVGIPWVSANPDEDKPRQRKQPARRYLQLPFGGGIIRLR